MSGAVGSANGGEAVKCAVERVLGMRIEKGEVQYLIQVWEPARNVRCPQKIAEFEKEVKEMVERVNKKSEEVTSTSQLADKDGAACPATNSITGCNQDQEENLVEDPEESESGGSMRISNTGNGKELGSGSTSSATFTKSLSLSLKQRKTNKDPKEVTSQTVEKGRAAGIVSGFVSGGSISSKKKFQKKRYAKDNDNKRGSVGDSKMISTGKELEIGFTSSPTVTKALPLKRRKKNKESKEVTSQTMGKDVAPRIVSSDVSGRSNEEDFERASGTSMINSTGREWPSTSGSVGSSTVSKELEALLNPLILTNLFGMIPPKQLATYRLVCKTWEENARQSWRSSTTLQLEYAKKQVTLLSDANSKNPTTLAEFLQFWDEECSLKPYRRFHLRDWKLFEPIVAKGKTSASLKGRIDRFWNLVGINITTLTLTNCGFSGADEMRKILFQSCPNLKTLVVNNCSTRNFINLGTSWEQLDTIKYSEPICGEQRNLKSLAVYISLKRNSDEWPYYGFPVTHLELLSHFPALTSLRISFPSYDVPPVTRVAKMWMNAIKVIRRHDESKLLLEQLEFDNEIWLTNDPVVQHYFNLLKEFNASVKSVNIDLGDRKAGENVIKDLISFHGKTLEKITAKEWKGRSAVNITNFGFPYGVKLDNLQTLNMCDRFCQNMEFIKYTSNLQELKINQREQRVETHLISSTFGRELENFQLVTLKKLELSCKVSDDDLKRLSYWLPNIKALKMSLNDAQFGVICEHWSQLAHLHVTDVGLTDRGILGTGSKLAKGMTNRMKALQASILRLNGLKCLKIRGGPVFGRTEMTDISAINGFMKLPQLEILSFNFETGFQLATKMDLCAKIPNCKLHSPNAPTVGCPCCERDAENGRGVTKKLASCDW